VLVVIWEFRPAAGAAAAFAAAYGPHGPWVELFRGAPGYLGTELLASPDQTRFVTLDRWVDGAHRDAFLAAEHVRYQALDAACATLTAEERCLGELTTWPASSAPGAGGGDLREG
jgi:quinol monooxygenase YgiN